MRGGKANAFNERIARMYTRETPIFAQYARRFEQPLRIARIREGRVKLAVRMRAYEALIDISRAMTLRTSTRAYTCAMLSQLSQSQTLKLAVVPLWCLVAY